MQKKLKKILKYSKNLLPVEWFRKLSKKQRFYAMAGVMAFLLIAIPAVIYTLTNAQKAYTASLSPIAWWKFDEGTGLTAYNSTSTIGINTDLGGGATWVTGKYRYGISTNGTSTSASIPNSTSLDFNYNAEFTVSFWVKCGTNDNGDNILEKYPGGATTYAYSFRYNNGGILFGRSDGTNNPAYTSTAIINNNVWHHVAGVKRGTNLYIYIDGQKQGSGIPDTTTTTTTNSSPICIGESCNTSTFWNGSIDNLKIYNYGLTDDQVKADMNPGYSSVLGTSTSESPPWWNYNWLYRQPITVTGTGSAITQFQVSFTLNTSATDSAGLIKNSKMKQDCSDLRIIDTNGNVLPFWIEEGDPVNTDWQVGCNSTTTKVWTKANTIPANGTMIYAYYGNNNAPLAASGKQTFDFFDDFDGAFNSNVWTSTDGTSGYTQANGNIQITNGSIYTNSTILTDARSKTYEYKVRWASTASGHSGLHISDAQSNTANNGGSNKILYSTVGAADSTVQSYGADGTSASNNLDNDTVEYSPVWNTYATDGMSLGWNNLSFNHNGTRTHSFVGTWTAPPYLWFGEYGGSSGSTTVIRTMTIDWVRVRKYGVYTASEPILTLTGSEQVATAGAMVGYWKFDENYGTTAYNSANIGTNSAALNATLTNATMRTSDGKFGKAIVTSTAGNYALIPNNSSINFAYNQNFTVSFWLKDAGGNSNGAGIVDKSNASGGFPFAIRYNAGAIQFVRSDGTNVPSVNSKKTINDLQWHHIVCMKFGPVLRIYIDGIKQSSDTTDTTTGTTTNGNSVNVGRQNGGTYYNGIIDELKIYNYSLTEQQIKADMNHGMAIMLGSLNNTSSLTGGLIASNSASALYCAPGDSTPCTAPVGEWNFDEMTGTTAHNSGSLPSIDATLTSSSEWSGGSGNFRGAITTTATNYATIPNSSSLQFSPNLDFTVSFWVKDNGGNSLPASIIEPWDNTAVNYPFVFRESTNFGINGVVYFQKYTYASSTPCAAWSKKSLLDGKWHYITGGRKAGSCFIYFDGVFQDSMVDTTVATDNLKTIWIGRRGDGAGTFNGAVGQLRIYNYGRNQNQISWEYNHGGPVAYWKLDECTGATAYDSSGYGNNGTINIGGTGSQTTAGTCNSPTDGTGAWYNGKTGKYNYSLSFDGTDDYLKAGVTAFSATSGAILAWVKPSSTPASDQIIVMANRDPNRIYLQRKATSGNLSLFLGSSNIDTGMNVPANKWSHLALVWNNGTYSTYLNGLFVSKGIYSGFTYLGAACSSIGSYYDCASTTNSYFPGQIDDVRVYNYPTSPDLIKSIMNQGFAARWGPSTGAP